MSIVAHVAVSSLVVRRPSRSVCRYGQAGQRDHRRTDCNPLIVDSIVGTAGNRARPRCSSLMDPMYTSLLASSIARLPAVVCDETHAEAP